MISGRDDLRSRVKELLGMLFGDPFAIGDILAVDDKKVDAVFLDVVGKKRDGEVKTRGTDNIAYEKDIKEL